MKNKIVILLFVVIILTFSIDRTIIKYTEKPCAPKIVNTPVESPCVADDTSEQTENDKITYKTFSSPKADFTFEYPDTWVYNEEKIENTSVWTFHQGQEKNAGDAILEVHSPSYEIFDSCSGSFYIRGIEKIPYQLNTFPTNDPETFIAYERCGGEHGSTYIYWQKGEYFANSGDIKDINKVNLMIFISGAEEGKNISQHIAQSIRIK
ncbi:MAG: hypothetical protein WA063_03900 [Minisyncoccia bacterium]